MLSLSALYELREAAVQSAIPDTPCPLLREFNPLAGYEGGSEKGEEGDWTRGSRIFSPRSSTVLKRIQPEAEEQFGKSVSPFAPKYLRLEDPLGGSDVSKEIFDFEDFILEDLQRNPFEVVLRIASFGTNKLLEADRKFAEWGII